MMIPEEGEILKYLPTGNIFEIKKITNQFIVLHSMDGLTQIMTGKKSLVNLFEKPRTTTKPQRAQRSSSI
jgi:hypothetical protein